MTTIIELVYNFLWGDLVTLPLPGGGTLGLPLLVILLIPTGIYFTIRTKISADPPFSGYGSCLK